jgi:hypothetical protein
MTKHKARYQPRLVPPSGTMAEYAEFLEQLAEELGVTPAAIENEILSALNGSNPDAVRAAVEAGFVNVRSMKSQGKA